MAIFGVKVLIVMSHPLELEISLENMERRAVFLGPRHWDSTKALLEMVAREVQDPWTKAKALGILERLELLAETYEEKARRPHINLKRVKPPLSIRLERSLRKMEKAMGTILSKTFRNYSIK